jgi:hypothetical protein
VSSIARLRGGFDPFVSRWYKPLVFGLTVALLLVGGVHFAASLEFVLRPGDPVLGLDFLFDRDLAERWLTTGSFYQPHQLTGRYVINPLTDPLYPPSALLLFVPFVYLPAILWWLIPLVVIVYVIAWLRPTPAFWPFLAFALAWPRSQTAILFGNTDIWAAAAVAAGVRWGWPAVFLVLKPSFIPFAVLGVRRRSFWVAAVVIGVVSLPMLALWLDWFVALRNANLDPGYSVTVLPLVGLPFVAWLLESRGSRESMPE